MNKEAIQSFQSIVEQYERRIINFHYRFVGNRQDAEDLAQETFIKAYKKLDTLKDKAKLRSWLFQIARNISIDHFRKHKDREVALENEALQHFAQLAFVDYKTQETQNALKEELDACLKRLSDQDRRIIKLLYYEGFSYKEISQTLGINQNTLKSRLHRVRQALLAVIRKNEYINETIAPNYRA
ncbi:MAG: RNA polymerase subunit sigma [Candidatus Yanofskybacteria bacterium CG10_big_fil_rev_8_21_14_0_10_46_23]|uniref:RNA polymerase sigma factor n=1 Tax=Candidatus Yanofskybacteria bacterium CG10_big_fil_rev_8_21_14_0_10_46_23 TaxID=1975098 RepID=A0A2H0R5L6_9BACT|nr:MAG: RNA polymerase subunit sigma [Candidatus Yanofskybacteria bacterium CG10_big_fil_rev_8_21_14_0_10_46_23]